MKLPQILGASLALTVLGISGVQANTLRMADSTDIAAMDPHSMTESNTIGFLNHVFEGLVRYNDALQVEPALAESWEFVEPTRVRFRLREGVTFHNGNPFNADDVVASIMRAADDASPVKSNLPGVASIEKVDDLTVDLVLKGTDPIVLNYLTNIYILDKEWMEAHDALMPSDVRGGTENYAVSNSNGTGPFMLESRQPEAKTVLVVNPNWWDTPRHNLTRIEFSPIASDATRIAALLSGELDFITPAPLQDIERINRSDRGVSVIEGPELRTIMLGFNYGDTLHSSNLTDANPLKDLRVRQALNLAIDMDLIQQKVMRGKSRNAGAARGPAGAGLRCGARRACACRPRKGQGPAGRGRLSRRVRGRLRLSERPLRERRGDLPGGHRDVGQDRGQGSAERPDQEQAFREGAARRLRHLHGRLGDPADARRLFGALGAPAHQGRPDGRLESGRLLEREDRRADWHGRRRARPGQAHRR